MEVIERVIEYSRPDKFYIYPLGDLHKGVIHCSEDSLEKKVNEIKGQRNALVLGMGDYADLIVPSDFRRWEGKIVAPWLRNHEDNIGPTQLDSVDEQLAPIWDKFIGLLEGNHEDSIRRYNHYNFMEEILKRANKKANVPYAGASCLVRLNFKRKGTSESHDYIIHARHGEGAARTSGARALAVLRLSQVFINANIVLMGHLHGQESPDIPQRLVLKHGKIKAFETIATMTGAWLKAYMQGVPPCYMERWGCPPSKLGCPRIVIEPDKDMLTLEKTATGAYQ